MITALMQLIVIVMMTEQMTEMKTVMVTELLIVMTLTNEKVIGLI